MENDRYKLALDILICWQRFLIHEDTTDIVKTPTQPQLNLTLTKFGFYAKMIWHTTNIEEFREI